MNRLQKDEKETKNQIQMEDSLIQKKKNLKNLKHQTKVKMMGKKD